MAAPGLSRQYAKLCAIEDFHDPALVAIMPEVSPRTPPDRPHRKGWEFALGALFLEEAGVLREDAAILDLAAGTEEFPFWLARRCGRVVATDIYGRGTFAGREATSAFLADPAAFAPYDYPRERLTVRDMDARDLEFADGEFDAVVSFSSIEHFGSPSDIRRAAAEIGRVLRPGGVAFLSTELFLRTSPFDSALVQTMARVVTLGRICARATPRRRVIGEAFTWRTLQRDVIGPSGLELLQPIDGSISERWQENVQTLHRSGATSAPHGEHPHVAMRALLSSWTSLALPLRKAHPAPRPAGQRRSSA